MDYQDLIQYQQRAEPVYVPVVAATTPFDWMTVWDNPVLQDDPLPGYGFTEPISFSTVQVPADWQQSHSQPQFLEQLQYQGRFAPVRTPPAYDPNVLDWRYEQRDPIEWPLDDARADLYGDRSFGPVDPPAVSVRRRRGFRTPRRTTVSAARRADNVLSDATVNTEIKPPAHWDVTYTNSSSLVFTYDADLRTLVATVVPGGIDHGQLAGLGDNDHPQYALAGAVITDHGGLTGLSDDDHSIYALLAGRSGGQSITGGTGSGDDLTLLSTSHGTKGTIFLGTASAYDQVNDRLGIGDTTPDHPLHVVASITSGPGANFVITCTQRNATDTGDAAIKSTSRLLASSASNEAIFRGYLSIVHNSLTGGGAITEMRSFNVAMLTDASTTTTDAVGVYIESDVASAGTVTNVRAIWIPTLYGTNKWGIYDQSGGVWETTGGGIVVGAATGGYKGAGTINVAGDIYKNNTAYTNPDYVFELAYRGTVEKYKNRPGAAGYFRMALEELEQFIRENLRLPRIQEEPAGIFDRGDRALEKIEELFVYLFEINERLKRLEEKNG